MSHHRETVHAEGAPGRGGPYSHAVISNGLIFLLRPDPDRSGDRRARRRLDRRPDARAASTTSRSSRPRRARSSPTRSACGIYVTDISTFKDVNEAYGTYFTDEPPARSTIGVAALPLGAQVEIDAVLAVPD